MVQQDWVSVLSILISATMLGTFATTIGLYAKYKIGQGKWFAVKQPAPLVHAAAQANANVIHLSKRKVSFAKTA